MAQQSEPYRRITDWSLEGRRRLIEEHGDEIRFLLDESFTTFAECYPLGAFGFRETDDPVTDAVEFAVRRFAEGDIEPGKIAGPPTLRLFTQVRFWLGQKVGSGAFHEIMRRLSRRGHPDQVDALEHPPADTDSAEQAAVIESFVADLGTTLGGLRRRTCADLVGFWLHASEKFRARVFGWEEAGTLSRLAQERSAKERSLHEHDALFRFLALHYQYVPDADESPASRALVASMFASCPNLPPRYSIDDSVVAQRLRDPAISNARAAGRYRKQGLRTLLDACLGRIEARDDAPMERLSHVLGLISLGLTTLHAYRIEDDMLKARLQALPRPPAEIAR